MINSNILTLCTNSRLQNASLTLSSEEMLGQMLGVLPCSILRRRPNHLSLGSSRIITTKLPFHLRSFRISIDWILYLVFRCIGFYVSRRESTNSNNLIGYRETSIYGRPFSSPLFNPESTTEANKYSSRCPDSPNHFLIDVTAFVEMNSQILVVI